MALNLLLGDVESFFISKQVRKVRVSGHYKAKWTRNVLVYILEYTV